MEKPYKIVLAVAFVVSLFLSWLLKDANPMQGALYLVFWGLVFFIVLSLTIGVGYYAVKKNVFPYPGLFITAVLLTAFLFFMDYAFWDKDPPNPPARQIIFESVFIGSVYVTLIFGVFSGLYFGMQRTYILITRLFQNLRRNKA